MNEKQFLEMAERERDRWIDKHVMGIKCGHADGTLLDEVNLSWQCSCGEEGEGFSAVCTSLPFYSTDANAMMRVIEKMREDGYYLELDNLAGVWMVWFEGKTEVSGVAENLETAVYLAAGRAKGVIE